MIIGTAPVRISFAGGGTDMPEYYEKYGGGVVTTSINRLTYAILHPRYDEFFQAFSPDFQKHYQPTHFEKIKFEEGTEIASAVIKFFNYNTGINVILCSDVPGGSGMGASSSLAVNLVNTVSTLLKKRMSKNEIAETASYIGRNILKWPIGKQDEYITAYGGLNFIDFQKSRIKVIPIKISKKVKNELDDNLILFFIGITRKSSKILNNQIKRIKNRNKQTIESLTYVKNLADSMRESLGNSDIEKFGELLNQGWIAKKKFAKNVSNEYIDHLYQLAIKNGALGGKLTGAGGGGHMIFYCEKNKQRKLITVLKKQGLKMVDFRFNKNRPRVLNLYDNH